MGTLKARTREYNSRGKVRASPYSVAVAADADADAIPENAEGRLSERLEQLMESFEHLREEIAMDLSRMEYQFDYLHTLYQRMHQRSTDAGLWISAQPAPSLRQIPGASL